MKRLLLCLIVVGVSLAFPAAMNATLAPPVPPPNCSDVCWNVSYEGYCAVGTRTTTCFRYLSGGAL